MMLIFKRISEGTGVPDIEAFVAPALKGGWFRKSGRLQSVVIQMHRETETAGREYHAVVWVEPDQVARRVIKRLNRKPLNGKPVEIAEMKVRHHSNDRAGRYQSLYDLRYVCRRRKTGRKIVEVVDQTNENT